VAAWLAGALSFVNVMWGAAILGVAGAGPPETCNTSKPSKDF